MANLRTNNLCGEGGRNAYRGSVQFNDDDYLQIADSADIEIGSNDYTVEFWAIFSKKTSSTEYEEIVNKGYPFQIYRYAHNDLIALAVDSNTSTYDINATFGTATRGDWHHIAVSRSGNTTKAFLNGIQGLSSTSSTSINDTSSAFTIGAYADSLGNYKFRGVISNLRVVIGTALYTADFTPPTEELTVIDGTAILCCQDSDDPTQEATGKTITANGDLADADVVAATPKVIPPYGVDAGNTFNGAISMNSPSYMCFPTGRKEERGRGRVIVFGNSSVNSSFEMATGGKATKFGNANFTIGDQHASCSSSTRAVRLNGYSPSTAPIACNVMEFVTIATESNATDFGDSTRACRYNAGFGSPTRGINANGNTPGAQNTIDYITIATTGDATDFGDLLNITQTLAGATSNTTRGLISGQSPGSNITEFITIATTGNAQDFGDATVAMEGRKGAADSTRALFASGYSHPTFATINTIDYFTIATTGNAVDFGDMTYVSGAAGGTSDSTRAVFMGGFTSPGQTTDTIDVVTIQTTGDAVEFGDMYAAGSTADAATSDSHGGIS